MKYIVALKTALNDIKAVVNLEATRKQQIAPLMNVRGNDDKQVASFLENWGDYPFLMEISRFPSDQNDQIIVEKKLHASLNAFEAKRTFFDWVKGKNSALIPVVSWAAGDPARDIVQCAVQLTRKFQTVAVQIDMSMPQAELDKMSRILDAVEDYKQLLFVLDFGQKVPPDLTPSSPTQGILTQLRTYGIKQAVLLSTSYPEDKPVSGSTRRVPSTDQAWQGALQRMVFDIDFIFGDYGATNPNNALEYVVGMAVIPFANYFAGQVWTQYRRGKDKEFHQYKQIAADIRSQSDYHGDQFCWATKEIGRIALSTDGKHGSNGTWNGFKINQHICCTLDDLNGLKNTAPANDDEDDDL